MQASYGRYKFREFELDSVKRNLYYEDKKVSLTPKQFDLLLYLVQNAGQIAKKVEILDAVWPDIFIAESTLARNISWIRQTLRSHSCGEVFIKTVPKVGYVFVSDVSYSDEIEYPAEVKLEEGSALDKPSLKSVDDAAAESLEKNTSGFEGQVPPKQNHIRSLISRTFLFPVSIVSLLLISAVFAIGYARYSKADETRFEISDLEKRSQLESNDARSSGGRIKVGSVVNLRNQHNENSGYLDVWGHVKDKADFRIVASELKFVSTNRSPNRENGSGSWKIVSAAGKREGETLEYGDRIHLRSMFPGGGYLDNCGYVKDMAVFSQFRKIEKQAVFTTDSKDRDNGTGTWIVSSQFRRYGVPVYEDDLIVLENGFPDSGYLNAYGSVSQIPSFKDYDGLQLVFIRASTPAMPPKSGLWKILISHH